MKGQKINFRSIKVVKNNVLLAIICFLTIFNLNVLAQNEPPLFISEPDTLVENDQTYIYNILAEDIDNDYFSVSAQLLPGWLTFYSYKVSTSAGSDAGYQDGEATSAKFWGPSAVAVDQSGNVFVAEFNNHRIRKITPEGMVSTIAGSGEAGYFDSTGIYAQFNHPSGIAVDGDGVIYVSEETNHTIRKILPDGTVSTLAGNGLPGFKDSIGIYASFNTPQGIEVDKLGNVYVADYNNNRIRRISADGVVTTFAGSGISGFANGLSDTAKFRGPADCVIDNSGNVFVCDTRNHRIRKISSDGLVSTIAGTGSGGNVDGDQNTATFWYPHGIALDKWGNIFISDGFSETIRKISPQQITTTMAGWQSPGYKNGTGKEAKFNGVGLIAVDSSGNIYIPELINQKIRKIEYEPLLKGNPEKYAGNHNVVLKASDLYGNFTLQEFSIKVEDVIPPMALCISDTILYLDESGSAMLDTESVNLGSYDENGIESLTIDNGFFSYENINLPQNVTLTVTDFYSNISTCSTKVVVQETIPESAPVFISNPDTSIIDTQEYAYVVSTYDANGNAISVTASELPDWLMFSNEFPVNNYAGSNVAGFVNGSLTESRFAAPNGLLFDKDGALFIADVGNNCIRKVKDDNIETFSGSGNQGYLDGSAGTAEFNSPVDIAMDKSGNFYVADFYNHVIRKILPDGTVITLAGTGVAGFKNGPGNEARFNYPNGLTVDSIGNVYVADFLNQRIRKISPDGYTTTFAGSGLAGFENGTVENAKFLYPSDVEFDKDGNLIVVDNGNNCIRKIIQGAIVRTLSGTTDAGFIDGNKGTARFDSPIRAVCDSLGNLYISDYYNFSIRKVTADGTTTTMAGNGLPGTKDSTGIFAQFRNAIGIAINKKGEVYVTDDHRIRKIEILPELTGDPSGRFGIHPVQLKASDSNGMYSIQNFTIKVKEETPPVALCRDTVVYLDSTGFAEINADWINNGSYDNSEIASLEIDTVNFFCNDADSLKEVTLTVTDIFSNASTCTAQILIKDTIKPYFLPVPDVEKKISLDSTGARIIYPEITAFDNCEFTLEQLSGLGAEATFPLGKTTEFWRATDRSGNSTEISFDVKIEFDNIPLFDQINDVHVLEDTTAVLIVLNNIRVGAGNVIDNINVFLKNGGISKLVSSHVIDYTVGDITAQIQLFIIPDSNGVEEWSVTLSDDEGRQSEQLFLLNVEAVNDPPFLVQPVADYTVFANEENEFEVSSIPGVLFDDVDNETLELEFEQVDGSSLPTWLSRNGDFFSATPILTDTGCVNILVKASDIAGATVSDTFNICVVDRLTGTETLEQDLNFTMFPSPTHGITSFIFNRAKSEKVHLQIFYPDGRLLLEKYSNENRINIDFSNYTSGMYLVFIKTGENTLTGKLVVE